MNDARSTRNGLEEPNYTQVPNALFEAMASMSNCELRVTLALVRKIIGFHKEKPEPVSYSQLMKDTGLSRQGVRDGLQAAKKRGWVSVSASGKQRVNKFTLNFLDPNVKLVNVVDQSTEQTKTSQRSRPKLVNVVDTQKKDLKEKKEKRSGTPPFEPAANGGAETAGAVQPGDQVWVWSDKKREHVQVTIKRTTAHYAIFTCNGSDKEFRRALKNVSVEKPHLDTYETLTPDQQVVAKWCRNVKPGEGIPGDTMAYINTVLDRCRERFKDKMPSADELERVFAWSKDTGHIQYTNPEKIPGLINDYRDAHKPQAVVIHTPSHKEADPNCPFCAGLGKFKDQAGNVINCPCRQPKEEVKDIPA